MKPVLSAIALIFAGVSVCSAQNKPTEACRFPDDGWVTPPGQKLQIAEVTRPASLLDLCESKKGCIASPATQGMPVLIYRRSRDWTCGYYTDRRGAGPAWIRSDGLRVVPYDPQPPLKAWEGIWAGGEDRVSIGAGEKPGTLRLEGSAQWNGAGGNAHFGDTKGTAIPEGNRLHFVESGSDSCAIDMTLLGRYIVASDNMACGALNARFQGIWKLVKKP